MDQQQQARWRPTRGQLDWAGVIAVLAFLILVICGYLFDWKWTGLPKRSLWDWLDLLIVPAVLAIGGYLFTRSENRRTQETANQQRALDRAIADERAATDRQIADQRRQDDMLQAYFDQMGYLLLDKRLRQSKEGDEIRTLARARTLSVSGRLDGERKGSLVQFLYESALIGGVHRSVDEVVFLIYGADLSNAYLNETDLRKADLRGADLRGAVLRKASEANLSATDLSAANLFGADLSKSDLRGTYLMGAVLAEANLGGADLSGAYMGEVNFREASLRGADLRGANLDGADMSAANLDGARVTQGQLHHVQSLEGATMPNGQKYEDWLKDREGRKEDG